MKLILATILIATSSMAMAYDDSINNQIMSDTNEMMRQQHIRAQQEYIQDQQLQQQQQIQQLQQQRQQQQFQDQHGTRRPRYFGQ